MNNDSIELAYIVLAHSDPAIFARLIRRLDDKRVAFFIHLDAKSAAIDFQRAIGLRPNVYFIEKPFKVMWAGVSQVQSTLASMKYALQRTSNKCTHFVVISGADYPIACNDEILDHFSRNKNRQFVRRFSLLDCGDPRQLWRLRGIHFREWADRFTWRRKPLYVLERFLQLFPRKVPDQIKFCLGSNWVAITRDFAQYCINMSEAKPELLRFLKHSFGPDEIYIHTLIENSPFVDQASPIEPYSDITNIGGPFHYGNVHLLVPNVPIKTRLEAESILRDRGTKLFTRKLSSSQSGEALDCFDEYLDRLR